MICELFIPKSTIFSLMMQVTLLPTLAPIFSGSEGRSQGPTLFEPHGMSFKSTKIIFSKRKTHKGLFLPSNR